MRHFLLLLPLFLLPFAAQATGEATPATDALITKMDDTERDYYFQLFDYVMENTDSGKPYPWKSYRASGQFTPSQKKKQGNTLCREYHEQVRLKNEAAAEADGLACKRVGTEGWCRLHKGDMRSCALEPPRTILDKMQRKQEDWTFEGSEFIRRVKRDWWDW